MTWQGALAERIGRLAEMSTDELIAINITSPDFNLATDELSQRRKGKVLLAAREDQTWIEGTR